MGRGRILSALLAMALLLTAVAWQRSAEYDEQYTLFLTGRVARPFWPSGVITAGEVRELQAAHAGFAAIVRDLRSTDVHPPLYFWAMAVWRKIAGDSLFAARLAAVLFSVVTLALIAAIARSADIPVVPAMLLTAGCYGFVYTGTIARGFALAQMLSIASVAVLLCVRRHWGSIFAAGMLLGAATFANYLSAFVASAVLLHSMIASCRQPFGGARRSQSWPGSSHGCPAEVYAAHCARQDVPILHRHAGRRPGIHVLRAASKDVDGGAKPRHDVEEPPVPDSDFNRTTSGLSRPSVTAECRDRWPAMALRGQRATPRSPVPSLIGFVIWVPATLWCFLGQRQSRAGQFLPFDPIVATARLARYSAATVFGGLPLYVDGIVRTVVTTALLVFLVSLIAVTVRQWRYIATPETRLLLVMAAVAPPIGLLALGLAFDNTPIELRYLAFATPCIGLLLVAALPRSIRYAVVLVVQAIALAGLMARPETMQPARATAMAAANLVGGGVVVLPPWQRRRRDRRCLRKRISVDPAPADRRC